MLLFYFSLTLKNAVALLLFLFEANENYGVQSPLISPIKMAV